MSAGEAIWLESTRTKADYWNAACRVVFTRPGTFVATSLAQAVAVTIVLVVALPAARNGDLQFGLIIATPAMVLAFVVLGLLIIALVVARNAWRRAGALESTSYVITSNSIAPDPFLNRGGVAQAGALETDSLLIVHALGRPTLVIPKRDIGAVCLGELKAHLRSILNGRAHFVEDGAI